MTASNASLAVATGQPPSYAPDFQRPVYCLLGLPFDAVTTAEAEQLALDAAAARRRCFFSTPNLNFLIAALSDTPFRLSVLRSDLSLADGMPIIWMARALGIPLTERVAGSTVFEGLRAQRRAPLRVYLFGGPDGVAARAAEVINAEHGAMVCVGSSSPGFGSIAQMSSPAQLAAINDSGADFLLVALGAQRGQAWIEHNLAALQVPVVSHLGAVINFVAGNIKRAPPRWGALGLEWLWRIKEEPTLWRRYYRDGLALLRLAGGKVLPGLLAQRRARARIAQAPAPQLTVHRQGAQATLVLAGEWHAAQLAPLRAALAESTATPSDIVLELDQVSGLDSATLGLLLLLFGHQSRLQRGFRIASLSDAARRDLDLACVNYLLQPLSTSPS
ncbi:WecB/TagA/CpsF family glycosyltransferase [Duganella dendranthematis]|uniref:WecB/TagA/CpsF family glycosyltransferase n=1 Tax=Duganella dendranthematis TaxID=2728021 RepID=UPI001E34BC10|nr:WecB/TagA/CpsF family glycosyltransferase [Duganella dendranthematis]